ncbi:MAG: DUF2807 domain-containing protein [Oscillochloris sp.]|nr:DUF2807 domain-containing protein [Oscillochloris sp.]
MPRHLTAALVLIVALLLAACATAVRGSGKVVTESRPVSDISAVVLDGVGTLYITQGDQEALTITADDNLLPLIGAEVRAGTLVLGPKSGTALNGVTKLTYQLTVKELRGLEVNGAAEVDAQNLQADQLRVKISGAGDCTATGRADQLELTVSGAGSFNGPELASRVATMNISGSGDALVQVSETLDAEISGAGSVRYIGSPKVTQHVSGSGSIAPR